MQKQTGHLRTEHIETVSQSATEETLKTKLQEQTFYEGVKNACLKKDSKQRPEPWMPMIGVSSIDGKWICKKALF